MYQKIFLLSLLIVTSFSSPAFANNGERLYYASKGGYLHAVKDLIEKKRTSVHYANPQTGETALHAASRVGNLAMMKYLLEKGANINSRSKGGITPLHEAAARGDIATMQYLISNGANDKAATVKGWLPLHHSARFGHIQATNMLLQRGTPIYLRTSEGQNIFDFAKTTKNRQMSAFLSSYAKNIRR